VILAFYPEDWSPVCSDQLALYRSCCPSFSGSTRSSSASRLTACGLTSLSRRIATSTSRSSRTFEPKGEVSRAYHVYRSREGTSERALYVIDAEGVVHWSYVSPVGINPGADGILRALEELQGRTGR
jgi:alkyl hydroperoxide reductase subunit AhpC